eukprot:UN01641
MAADNSTYGEDFAIDTGNDDFTIDYTRSNTKGLTQISTSEKKLKQSYFKSLKKWKRQYHGLTFSESIVRFLYNLSHIGITIGTVIYCIVFIIVIGSTVYSNYINDNQLNIEFIVIGINCIVGIISLLLNILPIILLFDYVLTCGGLGFTLGASWKINDGHENATNSTLVVFGFADDINYTISYILVAQIFDK